MLIGSDFLKNRFEKSQLYENLTNLQSYVDRVVAEKDALLAQLATLNGQLDERTNRLRQAGEAKMDTTLRCILFYDLLGSSILVIF